MKIHSRERLRAALVAVVLLVCACTPGSEPARPAGLPADAFWLGGPDGGVFVSLRHREEPTTASYSGAVYHPDGSVWYEGEFVLEPAGSRAVDPAERKRFAGWDGTRILLEEGGALVAKGAR